MKKFDLDHKAITQFELRNLMIASLQNKLCIEMAKDKCLCGEDEPARLSKNEFVMTADAVRAAGGGSVNKGAKRMYDLMNKLEARV